MRAAVRFANASSAASVARRRILPAGTFLDEGFIDFGMTDFEAGELICKDSMGHSAQLVNAFGLLACEFRR